MKKKVTKQRQVFRDVECRVCGKVPAAYFVSRVVRNDWICPQCVFAEAKANRAEKLKAIEIELGENK